MKKITLLLLLISGFVIGQTKPIVTKFGEIVNINPFVNNGLTASNGYVQLGGVLTHPSVLTTSTNNTLKISGLQTGTALDSILVNDASTGILKKVAAADVITNAWRVTGNAGTTAANFLGTTDAQNLIFKTNSAERMRMLSNGFIGIGTTSPTTALEVTSTADPLKLNGLQTGTTSDQLLTVNTTGVVRQQTVSSIVTAGTTHTLGLSGSIFTSTVNGVSPTADLSALPVTGDVTGTLANAAVKKINGSPLGTTTGAVTGARLMYDGSQWLPTNSPDWSLTGNTGTSPATNFLGTTDSNPLIFKTNSAERMRMLNNGLVGIGTTTPTTALEVSAAADPLKLNGLQTGITSDQLLTVNTTGVVRQQTVSSIVTAGTTHTLGLSGSIFTSTVNGVSPTADLSALPVTGDVTGTLANAAVKRINGSPLGTTTGAVTGARLMYDGSQWLPTTSPDWSLTGNTGTSPATNFLGTTDSNPLIFKTNSVERMRMLNNGLVGIGTTTPTTALEVSAAADPLKLNGLQTAPVTDKILTVDNNGVVHKARSMRTGFVMCTGPVVTVNDPDITATSTIILTVQDNSIYNVIVACLEGPRVPGVSFSLKFYGWTTFPPNSYGATYLIFY